MPKPKITAAQLIARAESRADRAEAEPPAAVLAQIQSICDHNDAQPAGSLRRVPIAWAVDALHGHGYRWTPIDLNRVCKRWLGRQSFAQPAAE